MPRIGSAYSATERAALAAEDGEGHVLLGVGHLVAGGVGQFEADVVEHQDRHQSDEARVRRREVAGSEAVQAVLDPVDHDGDGEQAEEDETAPGADGGNPLADVEGEDRGEYADPDEHQGEDVEGRCAQVLAVVEEGGEGRDGGDRERAAQPHRVGDPVKEVVDGAREAAEGPAGPDVGTALFGERGPELRGQQRGGHEEHDGQHDEPGERLGTGRGHRADGVHADDGAQEEEEDVEAAEVLAQLLPLRLGRCRLGRYLANGHWGSCVRAG